MPNGKPARGQPVAIAAEFGESCALGDQRVPYPVLSRLRLAPAAFQDSPQCGAVGTRWGVSVGSCVHFTRLRPLAVKTSLLEASI